MLFTHRALPSTGNILTDIPTPHHAARGFSALFHLRLRRPPPGTISPLPLPQPAFSPLALLPSHGFLLPGKRPTHSLEHDRLGPCSLVSGVTHAPTGRPRGQGPLFPPLGGGSDCPNGQLTLLPASPGGFSFPWAFAPTPN